MVKRGMDSDFEGVIRQGRALTGELVIDAHSHLGLINQYAVPQPETAGLVATMDRYGVDRAITFGFAGVGSDFVYGNDLVVQAVEAYPERFVGFATLSANYPEEMIPELERTAALGLRGIKLIAHYQGQPEETERFFPAYEWANERGWMILSHQWGAPAFLDEIAGRHPDVCFLIGHLNLAYAPVARRRENVYTTTTFVPWPGAVARAVAAFGAEKILFGSDQPDLDIALNLGPLLTAAISDEEKRLILGRNAARLLTTHGG